MTTTHMTKEARASLEQELKAGTASRSELATKYSISRQRVYQIAAALNLPKPERKEATPVDHAKTAEEKAASRAAAAAERVKSLADKWKQLLDIDKFAADLGVKPTSAYQMLLKLRKAHGAGQFPPVAKLKTNDTATATDKSATDSAG
jgi:predicted DNA-binding transcriptional regulator AlpA